MVDEWCKFNMSLNANKKKLYYVEARKKLKSTTDLRISVGVVSLRM